MSRKGGVLSGGFQPLKAPNAPTVDSVSAGILSASVTVSAPANTGDGTVSGYVVTAKQSDGSLATGTASSAGAVSVTLTAGGTTEFAAQAFSEYGPGQFSGFGNSTSVPSGQELYSWGNNAIGMLGQNNDPTIDRSSPVQIGALTTWANIAQGPIAYAGMATRTDGTLWAWGYNSAATNGALMDNSVINRSSPVQVGALTNWAEPAQGRFHSVAIKTDGTIWSAGYGAEGRLGVNSTVSHSSPVQIGSLTTWYKVAAGRDHTLSIKTDGTLWAWGSNNGGYLGINSTIAKSSPTQVGSLTTWASVTAGQGQSLAIKTDGTLWAWGNNGAAQLGLNFINAPPSSPVQVGALTNWSQVSAGLNFTAAVKTDGTLWTWGDGGLGKLGLNEDVDRSSPVQVGSLTDWSQVSAGQESALAIKTDGTVWSWGDNDQGQLGLNDIILRSSPVQVGASTSWYKVSSGPKKTLAIEQSFT
jgi:alpha-tubulin suppressor-like RCC1 family protein